MGDCDFLLKKKTNKQTNKQTKQHKTKKKKKKKKHRGLRTDILQNFKVF